MTTDSIIRKIRALRAKTIDAGATEAEADAAASLAQRLMAEHQIDDISLTAADYGVAMLDVKGVRLSMAQSHPCIYAGSGIAHISGTKLYASHGQGVSCVGDVVGREVAGYLFDLVYAALEAAWTRERARRKAAVAKQWSDVIDGMVADGKMNTSRAAHLRKSPTEEMRRNSAKAWGPKVRKSFMTGMADRMARRMLAMPPARKVPDDVVARVTADMKIKDKGKPRPRQFDAASMLAGIRAGDAAQISMGVRDAVAVPQLTKSEGA